MTNETNLETTYNLPAFPVHRDLEDYYPGIRILDYFAAKAMQGVLSDSSFDGRPEKIAEISYKMSAAMLEARKKYIK